MGVGNCKKTISNIKLLTALTRYLTFVMTVQPQQKEITETEL